MSGDACPDLEHQLEALLFDELHGRERDRVERHIIECERCQRAYENARVAIDALATVDTPPLPYGDTPKVMRWLDLQASRSTTRWMSLAAVLVVGILLGRVMPRGEPVETDTDTHTVSVDPEALAALERAELLSDVGVRYVSGLRDVLGELARLSVQDVSVEEAAFTRERARSLIRDGVLLTRSLDPAGDRGFLRAIRRAGPFLEELAALETSTDPTNVRLLQASLRDSGLPRAVAGLALEDDIERALTSSGFLAGDYPNQNATSRKDF